MTSETETGTKGDEEAAADHGEALECVRCRYDEASRTWIKTAEIIVEKKRGPRRVADHPRDQPP